MKQNVSANGGNNQIKILIVEDEKELLYSIAFILKRQGYMVATSTDAEKALNILTKDNEQPFDLVITDIQLPGISGIELIDKIKSGGIAVSVLVITAYRGSDLVNTLIEKGAEDLLIKPFDTSELISKIKSVLHQAGRVNREK